jgi:hypothetical protein
MNNVIGILIHITSHMMAFYKCDDKLMFCDDDFIVEYDWKNLLLLFKQNILKYELIYYRYMHIETNISGNFISNDLFYFKNKNTDDYYNINNERIIINPYQIENHYKINILSSINIINKETIDLITEIKSENTVNALQILEKPDCDVNYQDDKQNSALMIAIEKGYNEVALQILKKPNCDVNLANDIGLTALFIAIKNGNEPVALQILKNSELNINYLDMYGKNALSYIMNNFKNIVFFRIMNKMILENYDKNTFYDKTIVSNYHTAKQKNIGDMYVEIIKRLLPNRQNLFD